MTLSSPRSSAPSAKLPGPPPHPDFSFFLVQFCVILGVLVLTSQNSFSKPYFHYFGGHFCYLFLTLYLDVQSYIFCRRPMRNRYFYLPGRPQKGSKNDSKKRPSPEGLKRPPRSRNGLQNRSPNWSKNHRIRGPFFSGCSWGQLGPLLHLPGPSGCPSCPLPAPSWANLDHLGAKLGFPCALLALLGVHLAPFLPHLGIKLGKLGPALSLLVPILPTLAHLLANSQLHSVFISLCKPC